MEKLTEASIRQYPLNYLTEVVFQEAVVPELDIQFKQMKRWTKKVDLFNREIQFIMMPICENNHW
jgi:hypothetical protein